MAHKFIITTLVGLIAASAVAELLFPAKLLAFVGITSNLEMDFLLRTTAVALIALLPSLWTARNDMESGASQGGSLFGAAAYMFLSSAIDYQAYTQGIVNLMSVPSILLRVFLGAIILWLIFRRIAK